MGNTGSREESSLRIPEDIISYGPTPTTKNSGVSSLNSKNDVLTAMLSDDQSYDDSVRTTGSSFPQSLQPNVNATNFQANKPTQKEYVDGYEDFPNIHFCEQTNEPKDVCNAQWLLLYTYAAYASSEPKTDEQKHLKVFFEEFPDQCSYGPQAFCYKKAVKAFPPRITSRRELLLWLCMVENQCRVQAKMPRKHCSYTDLMRRWRYEDGYI